MIRLVLRSLFFLAAFISTLGAEEHDEDSSFRVRFEVSISPKRISSFVIEVYPDWAPLGAARFREIIEENIWKNGRFYRVMPSTLVEWGIPGNIDVAAVWKEKRIRDDPPFMYNKFGTVSFQTQGEMNSRTTQVFVNLRDNSEFGGKNLFKTLIPFGKIVDGIEVFANLYRGYGEKPNKEVIQSHGNKYLKTQFPNLSYITDASFVEEDDIGEL